MDVLGVATGTEAGMASFEKAVYKWCEKVMTEVVAEWREDQDMLKISPEERKERRRSRRMDSGDRSPSLSSMSSF